MLSRIHSLVRFSTQRIAMPFARSAERVTGMFVFERLVESKIVVSTPRFSGLRFFATAAAESKSVAPEVC